jgi:organic hydroperoxide reductase OsmC/OhrA
MLQQGHLPFGVCMSLHRVELKWARQSAAFEYETYSRDHTWTFENGVTIEASATPHFLGNASRVDPEESFVASLSSCHMLTFLAIAARKRWTVDVYEDRAVGVLEPNAAGKLAITTVTLNPHIVFSGNRVPTAPEIDRTHELAHQECFLANSVHTRIVIEGS